MERLANATRNGFTNKEAFLIYLLLKSNFNESLDWANTIKS